MMFAGGEKVKSETQIGHWNAKHYFRNNAIMRYEIALHCRQLTWTLVRCSFFLLLSNICTVNNHFSFFFKSWWARACVRVKHTRDTYSLSSWIFIFILDTICPSKCWKCVVNFSDWTISGALNGTYKNVEYSYINSVGTEIEQESEIVSDKNERQVHTHSRCICTHFIHFIDIFGSIQIAIAAHNHWPQQQQHWQPSPQHQVYTLEHAVCSFHTRFSRFLSNQHQQSLFLSGQYKYH